MADNEKTFHLISGLPRSGSTLLAGILRQNPQFYAAVTSPVNSLIASLQRCMSGANELFIFFNERKRRTLLKKMFDGFYVDCSAHVIFDTSRAWCAYAAVLGDILPDSRIICCVRNPAWVLDSIEFHAQRNSITPSRMFDYDPDLNIYSRTEILTKPTGLFGAPLAGLRQAWFGEAAKKLIVIRYESLTEQPKTTIEQLYSLLGYEPFKHDYQNVQYSEPEFDAVLGLRDFHTVRPRVEPNGREPVLPPDLFSIYDNCFWNDPQQNPRNVIVL